METLDAIKSRRNVRAFRQVALDAADIDVILEAGRRSPSASNRQMWDFVVCTDRQQLQELSRVWRGAGHVAGSAAAIALISPNPEDARTRDLIQYDLGHVTMSMMLAAADRGIGSCHSAVADQDLARQLLGFPAGTFCAWLISLGYPADRPLKPMTRPNRRPFDQVVHRGRW